MPDTLQAGGIELPLQSTDAGPLVSTHALEDAVALGWIVNLAFDPGQTDLVDRLRRGEAVQVGREGPYAREVWPRFDDDLSCARDRWRRLSGVDPGDDALILGTGWGSPRILVPRSAILELIERLSELRRGFR
jgi:hypothetical protein